MAVLTKDPKIDTRNLPIRITMLELGFVGSIILAGVLILMLRLDLRKDIYQTLAFAWVPASIWLTMLVVSLRIRPRSVLRSWRRWLGWVGLISLLGGILSWFDAGGMLQEIGMGGTWGAAIGGATLLGVFKLIVLAALTGSVFFPKITKRIFFQISYIK